MNKKLWHKTLIALMAIDILLASCSAPSAPKQAENQTFEPAEMSNEKNSLPTASPTLKTLLTITDTPIPMTDIPVVVTNTPLPPTDTPLPVTDIPPQGTLIPEAQVTFTGEPRATRTAPPAATLDNSALLDSLQNQLIFALGGGGGGLPAAMCLDKLENYIGPLPAVLLSDHYVVDSRTAGLCLIGLDLEDDLQISLSSVDGKPVGNAQFRIVDTFEGGATLDQVEPIKIARAGEIGRDPGKSVRIQLNLWLPPDIGEKVWQVEAQSSNWQISGQVRLEWPEDIPALYLEHQKYNPFAPASPAYNGVVDFSDLARLEPGQMITLRGTRLPANQTFPLALYQRRNSLQSWEDPAKLVAFDTVQTNNLGELDYPLSIGEWIPPGLYHLTVITNLERDSPYAGPFIGIYADTCPGAPDSFLLKGDIVVLNPEFSAPNNIRNEPAKKAKIVGKLSEGETAEIRNNFRCADQMVWWKVRTSSGVEGWTAEGQGDERFIVPAE